MSCSTLVSTSSGRASSEAWAGSEASRTLHTKPICVSGSEDHAQAGTEAHPEKEAGAARGRERSAAPAMTTEGGGSGLRATLTETRSEVCRSQLVTCSEYERDWPGGTV